MTRRLDPAAAERLAKVLGRLGSDFDGERAAAACAAHRIVRDAGLSWQDVLGVVDDEHEPPTDHRALARWALARLPELSERNRDFLETMAGRLREPTPKQWAWLDGLAARARAAA